MYDGHNTEILETVNATIDNIQTDLRDLSLKIHAHPELAFEERYAHDLLTHFMVEQGFQVTKHYLNMDTAWKASFDHKDNTETNVVANHRVIGINSEMDALPGIGHACGHNLIAVAGIAVALILKKVMLKHNVPGSIVLLGTPAEEKGGGKLILLERGAYEDMDICLMCHPCPGPVNSFATGTMPACQAFTITYKGKSAHSSNAPWEGRNALDAAFLAYSGLALLRQQMEPGTFSHGTIYGNAWAPNVIPDLATLEWMIRAPTILQLGSLRERALNCFKGSAIQSGCSVEIEEKAPWNDVKQNSALAAEFSANIKDNFGGNIIPAESPGGSATASTDFGNVGYAIPTVPGRGNHTPEFEKSACTQEAFQATVTCAKALAMTGIRVLRDPKFYSEVKQSFGI